jgi:glucan-binding YG repeat protein
MKRNFKIKIIIALLLVISTVTINPIKANATIYTANASTSYADSYQWVYRNGGWQCATPDFHQGYANAWICTNGKWYYVNNYGWMVSNTWVDNYYVDSTGAWIKTR